MYLHSLCPYQNKHIFKPDSLEISRKEILVCRYSASLKILRYLYLSILTYIWYSPLSEQKSFLWKSSDALNYVTSKITHFTHKKKVSMRLCMWHGRERDRDRETEQEIERQINKLTYLHGLVVYTWGLSRSGRFELQSGLGTLHECLTFATEVNMTFLECREQFGSQQQWLRARMMASYISKHMG